jgi:hypothetical protein
VASGLLTLLELERYDVRRVAHLTEASAVATVWTPDVVLVDGTLLRGGERGAFAAPAVVLSDNASDGATLMPQLADGRGWLRRDATTEELRTAIERAVGMAPRIRASSVLAALSILAIAGLLLWGWLALRSAV